MEPRNHASFDINTGLITVTNHLGAVVMQRPARTPEMALREFEYALEHLDIEFKPNAQPK